MTNPLGRTPVLTSEQVRLYHEQGFVGPLTMCSADEMVALMPEISAVLTTKGRAPAPPRSDELGRLASHLRSGDESPIPYYECRYMDSRLIYDLCAHPVVIDCLSSVLGPDLLLWRSQFIEKRFGTGEFRWHQDFGGVFTRGTEYGLEPPLHVTVWLAITEATRENGCLQFIPGVKRVLPTVAAGEGRNAFYVADPACVVGEVVEMPLEPGQFVLFSDRALHHSEPSRSHARRIGLTNRYTLPSVRVRPHFPGHKSVVIAGRDTTGFNELTTAPAPLDAAAEARAGT